MNFRKYLIQAFSAAILSFVAAFIFTLFYNRFVADFSRILNPLSIFSAYLFMNVFYSFAYFLGEMWKRENSRIWVNVILTLLTFIGVFLIFLIKLPLDIPNPELFPGLAVPLLLFPMLGYYMLLPFFERKSP